MDEEAVLMSVATEEQRIRSLFERVEAIEEVAGTLAEDDDRRTKLLAVSRDALACLSTCGIASKIKLCSTAKISGRA
jgi:hypothetical protein